MQRLAGLVTAFLVLAGAVHTPAQAQDKTLTVFAAASMRNALDAVNAAYTVKNGVRNGIRISASYAASSALAKQLAQGAPADVYVSADAGDHWVAIANNLPAVLSVEVQTLP